MTSLKYLLAAAGAVALVHGAGGRRRFKTKKQVWEKKTLGSGTILCRVKTRGWCRRLGPENKVCEKRHSGTWPASKSSDKILQEMGIAPMCGTGRFFQCDFGKFTELECDDATMRFHKDGTKFPELLNQWQLSQAKKAKWWGSCKGNSEAALTISGWDGDFRLAYSDDDCEWVKQQVTHDIIVPQQSAPVPDQMCGGRADGTHAASPDNDAQLSSLGMAPMCGTNQYFQCDSGKFTVLECDDPSLRFHKEGTHFKELLSSWQMSQKGMAQWWGSCKGNDEAPLSVSGWDGEYALRYDDASCAWKKESIVVATAASIYGATSQVGDEDLYNYYKDYDQQ